MKTKQFSKVIIGLSFLFILSLSASAQYYHQRYYGRGYLPVRGERVYSIGHPYLSIGYGGYNYAYYGGAFYRPYGGYFQVVAPPFGLRIGLLPYGYRTIYVGPDPYYYYNGIYYRPYAQNNYEVVAPPVGAKVPELPRGAEVKVIDGQKYYELDGTYYKEEITDKGEIWYTVAGREGVLNTDNNPATYDEAIGDKTDRLPEDSKAVVIHGQKYYESPSGTYYQEIIEGNQVHYEIVGKSAK